MLPLAEYALVAGNYSSLAGKDLVIIDIPAEYQDSEFIHATLLPLFANALSIAVLVITSKTDSLPDLLSHIATKALPHSPVITYVDTQNKFFTKITHKKFKVSLNGRVAIDKTLAFRYIAAFPEFKDIVSIKTANIPALSEQLIKRVCTDQLSIKEQLDIDKLDMAADFYLLYGEKILFIDIETYSLFFMDAGVHSISFTNASGKTRVLIVRNEYVVLRMLKKFFENYEGVKVFHNGAYDIKVLVYSLFMDNILDRTGLLHGWKAMTKNYEDSMLLAYTCLNSVKRQEYSLKVLAGKHLGDYALDDIENIRSLQDAEVITYNGLDTIATKLVFTEYLKEATDKGLVSFYTDYLIPTQKTLIYTEMCGMPVRPSKIVKLSNQIETLVAKEQKFLASVPEFLDAMLVLQVQTLAKTNSKLKKKIKTLDDIPLVPLLLTSSDQMSILFYDIMKLPVLVRTGKTAKPSVSEDALRPLLNYDIPESKKKIISSYLNWISANKILSTYVPALGKAVLIGDDTALLFGNFSCSKQISGRLSSSNPNLQNLPVKGEYGKLIKACFIAPDGWLYGGADFSSLEDRISALLTKDPNKLRVYTGHEVYEVTTPEGVIVLRDDSTINGKTVQEMFNDHSRKIPTV